MKKKNLYIYIYITYIYIYVLNIYNNDKNILTGLHIWLKCRCLYMVQKRKVYIWTCLATTRSKPTVAVNTWTPNEIKLKLKPTNLLPELCSKDSKDHIRDLKHSNIHPATTMWLISRITELYLLLQYKYLTWCF